MSENENMQERKEVKNYRLGTEAFPIWKQITLFAVGWLGFQILALLYQAFIVGILRNALANGYIQSVDQYLLSMTINSITYIFLLIILLCISYIDIPKLLKSFKHWQSYLAGAICFAAIMTFNIQYNLFINTLRTIGILKNPVSDNINQASLVSLDKLYPLTSLIIFGFIGPICEELTYRVGLFSLCKRRSRALAYVITIIVFAFIHFNFDTKNLLNEILNLPFYAFAAAAFSFTYDHFGFAGSLTGHVINNVFSLAFVATIH